LTLARQSKIFLHCFDTSGNNEVFSWFPTTLEPPSDKTRSARLHGYCDSSHADVQTRHSTLAYVFCLDSAISWFSKLHTYVTSCTNHSEYAALFVAAKEAQWLVYLFSDLKQSSNLTPIPIYLDSSGVVSTVDQHVEIAHHFSRELTEKQVIIPQCHRRRMSPKPLAAPAFLAGVHRLVNTQNI